ncbi:MAG TPA: DedA family protein [Actinomycetota bacterium]|nr:DedA family protein [Actinomycetota bacterium]
MTDDQQVAQTEDLDIPPPPKTRLTDGQAFALLGAYFVFRTITQRIGLGSLPALLKRNLGWTLPLLNNSMVVLIAVGTDIRNDVQMIVLTAGASVLLSTVAGLILYWAGYRFGPQLAVKAEKEGSTWASIWNPKKVERAHRWLEKYGFLTVVVGRLVEWLTLPVVLVAGSSRMSFKKFLAAHTLGAVGFALGCLYIGGRAGDRWPWLPDKIKGLAAWSLKLTLILVVLLVVASLFKGKPDTEEDAEADRSGAKRGERSGS